MDNNVRAELMKILASGKNIPETYKDIIFPTINKEYELSYAGKMRAEDVLSCKDGVYSMPLQVEKTFGTKKNDWSNIICFGDNLQLLKTINENIDPIIKDKVKGKVKLIYIDPPFATESDFKNSKGVKAYSDKVKGTEFIEFLRKRLILAKEILAEDGSIYVHLDEKMSHYIKVVMDEVFGSNCFQREIVWRIGWVSGYKTAAKNWIRNHDVILYYTKDPNNFIFNKEYIPYPEDYVRRDGSKPSGKGVPIEDTWNCSSLDILDSIQIMSFSGEKTNYPTQKNENLIARIIKASTNPGDLIMDFFGGSGTTAAVAEKLDRKWITCDLGKLSYYTMQKRILNIENSKSILDPTKKYNKKPANFITCQLGLYDLNSVINLPWKQYVEFVSDLFEIKPKKNKINGIEFDGTRNLEPTLIWDFKKYKDVTIDENYINNLYLNISNKYEGNIYIVAPANCFDFIEDYYEINNNRFYFLKIPYQIIRELHNVPFKKMLQPNSKNNVNNIDESIGFHFIKQPTVQSKIVKNGDELTITISEFRSYYYKDEKGKILENFETLSALFIDYDYEDTFIIDDVFFADEFKKENQKLLMKVNNENIGEKVMLIYVDMYGNEFKEIIQLGGDSNE
ncbi:MAG: site-specific DNA-methyltransferase [Bacilli bacterium]|nr:site-specific DNA-methyltransferase [Bacilli bacterium]